MDTALHLMPYLPAEQHRVVKLFVFCPLILQGSDSICDAPKASLNGISFPLVPNYEVCSCILLQCSCTADGLTFWNLVSSLSTQTSSVNFSEWNLTDCSLFLQFTKCVDVEKLPRHKAPALCQKVTLTGVISVKQNTHLGPAEMSVHPGVLFEPFHFPNRMCFWKIGSS